MNAYVSVYLLLLHLHTQKPPKKWAPTLIYLRKRFHLCSSLLKLAQIIVVLGVLVPHIHYHYHFLSERNVSPYHVIVTSSYFIIKEHSFIHHASHLHSSLVFLDGRIQSLYVFPASASSTIPVGSGALVISRKK